MNNQINIKPGFPSPEVLENRNLEELLKKFPLNSLVLLKVTGQIGKVGEIKITADGPCVRVPNIGLIPVDELRAATVKDIEKSDRFRERDIEKVGDYLFFKS